MEQREHAERVEPVNTCIICGQARQEGIRIVTAFICLQCEEEMVQTDVKDEKYPYFIHQLKSLWFKKDA